MLTAERLAADFEVGVEHARRALEELRSFESQPASTLVTDGSGLLGEPGSWARDVAALEAVFGLRRAEWLRPYRAEAWPAFTVGLPSGAAALVVYRTDLAPTPGPGCVELDEEYQVDFWLAPGDGGPGMVLADLSGHWFGPASRWVELRGIVQAALPDRVAAARRLLLAPFLGDAAAGDEAVDWLAWALGFVSGRDRRSAEVRALAGIVLGGLSAKEWRLWNGVWVNDGCYCKRSPGREY
ncbi:hypothetical protein [Actinoplanes regularis]|uniref:hypothetical protein n=1 Tax=Actinoplanes regularis TaxID=52697 RepID=UPI00255556E1|nr:hypothetical protein [Actinoplanes regularis]